MRGRRGSKISFHFKVMNNKEKEELRKKVRKTTEDEIIRDAMRARKFSGAETLAQGIDLIDFALRIRKMRDEKC
jgi:hypothetical protein